VSFLVGTERNTVAPPQHSLAESSQPPWFVLSASLASHTSRQSRSLGLVTNKALVTNIEILLETARQHFYRADLYGFFKGNVDRLTDSSGSYGHG